MKKYAVLGLGKFGQHLAIELANMGNEVLAVDKNEENLFAVQDYVTHVVIADVTDEDAIRELGIEEFDGIIIGIGKDVQNSIMCAIICRECNPYKLWAKATSELHAKALKKVGVDRVVLVEREMGMRIAHHISNNNIVDYISLSNDYQMVELEVKLEWVGKSIAEVNFRTKYGINIIGIRREDDFTVSPQADFTIQQGDILCIIGKNTAIDRI